MWTLQICFEWSRAKTTGIWARTRKKCAYQAECVSKSIFFVGKEREMNSLNQFFPPCTHLPCIFSSCLYFRMWINYMRVDNFALARVFFSLYSQLTDEKKLQSDKWKNKLILTCKKLNSRFGLVLCLAMRKDGEKIPNQQTTNIKYRINENDLRFGVRHFWRAT